MLLRLFSHRLLAIARWDLRLLQLRLRNVLTGQHHQMRNFAAGRQRPVMLNLGSGPRGKADAHWVNIDAVADRNVHFLLDFARPLPFAGGSFAGVFCEHVLEHFSLADGEKIAGEVHRVLEEGGLFRVIVPDAEKIVRLYLEAPEELVAYRGEAGATAMVALNSFFRQRYEHQFLYDWQTLKTSLAAAGFREISRRACGEGAGDGALLLDDPKYAWESLYVEAVK